jgi:hypothetical protein
MAPLVNSAARRQRESDRQRNEAISLSLPGSSAIRGVAGDLVLFTG